MAKKKGLFTLLMGMAAGAAATFLSDEKNRETAKKLAAKAVKTAQQAKADYQADPEVFKAKIKVEAEKTAKKLQKRVVAKKSTGRSKKS